MTTLDEERSERRTQIGAELVSNGARLVFEASPKTVSDASWEWTVRAIGELTMLAQACKEATLKETSLRGKLALQARRRRALDAVLVVAKVFSDLEEP